MGPFQLHLEQRQRRNQGHMVRKNATRQLGRPGSAIRRGMSQDVDTAVDRDIKTVEVGWMRENRFAIGMSGCHQRPRLIKRHGEYADLPTHDGTRKQFHTIRACVNLPMDTRYGRGKVGNFLVRETIVLHKLLYIDRRAAFRKKRIADRQDLRTHNFAVADAAPNFEGIRQLR